MSPFPPFTHTYIHTHIHTVGAPDDGSNGIQGLVYIYTRKAAGRPFTLKATIAPPDENDADFEEFGRRLEVRWRGVHVGAACFRVALFSYLFSFSTLIKNDLSTSHTALRRWQVSRRC